MPAASNTPTNRPSRRTVTQARTRRAPLPADVAHEKPLATPEAESVRYDGEQVVRLGLCERRGGLVHEDELCVARERACDRHQLSSRNRQTLQRRAEWSSFHAELGDGSARGRSSRMASVIHEPLRAHEAVEGECSRRTRHFRKSARSARITATPLRRASCGVGDATLSPK